MSFGPQTAAKKFVESVAIFENSEPMPSVSKMFKIPWSKRGFNLKLFVRSTVQETAIVKLYMEHGAAGLKP